MTHHAEHTMNGMNMFGIITLAAVAGAVAALLTAPRKGSETREQLRDMMERTRDKSMAGVEAAKDKTQVVTSKIRGKTQDKLTEAEDAATEARSQVEDAIITDTKPRSRRDVTPI